MKPFRNIIIISMILLFPLLLLANNDMEKMEATLASLQKMQHDYLERRADLQQQLHRLSAQIAAFGPADQVTSLQRRKIEGFMKESQMIAAQLERLQKDINFSRSELELQQKNLIAIYENEIHLTLKKLDQKPLAPTEKRGVLERMVTVKNKRERLRADMNLPVSSTRTIYPLNPDDMQNASQLKQHIDWLQDRDEQLRADAYEVEHIVGNLREEIDIRDKMAEMEHEMNLFGYRDETVKQSPSINENDEATKSNDPTTTGHEGNDFAGNAYLEPPSNSNSSLLHLYPDLFSDGYSVMSTNDIDRVIKQLQDRRQKLITAADSVRTRAIQLQQQVDRMERQPTTQDNK
jgi:hypothetical protein